MHKPIVRVWPKFFRFGDALLRKASRHRPYEVASPGTWIVTRLYDNKEVTPITLKEAIDLMIVKAARWGVTYDRLKAEQRLRDTTI